VRPTARRNSEPARVLGHPLTARAQQWACSVCSAPPHGEGAAVGLLLLSRPPFPAPVSPRFLPWRVPISHLGMKGPIQRFLAAIAIPRFADLSSWEPWALTPG